MHTTETVIDSFAAMDIVTREPARFASLVEITADDTVALQRPSHNYGPQWHAFSPGSVISYARKSGFCAIDALDRARKHGHQLHWFNPCSVSITSHARPKETWIGLAFGQRVKFEGRIFRIMPDAYNRDHVRLVDETAEANAAGIR